jgi:hypothetical protein
MRSRQTGSMVVTYVNQFCLVVSVMTDRVSRHLYEAVTAAHPRLIILTSACERNHSGLHKLSTSAETYQRRVRVRWCVCGDGAFKYEGLSSRELGSVSILGGRAAVAVVVSALGGGTNEVMR